MSGWNLPPGVTNSDIDRAFGPEDELDEERGIGDDIDELDAEDLDDELDDELEDDELEDDLAEDLDDDLDDDPDEDPDTGQG